MLITELISHHIITHTHTHTHMYINPPFGVFLLKLSYKTVALEATKFIMCINYTQQRMDCVLRGW
jgi:hypothetical protein